ncbi:MAG: hypothetical protein A2268_04940 [Candidatus Raymondbacteria bacterium RifOxyA12_full_50_37]|uniref:Uncharacterized protein n=1 Tax=Candidatus Raymondbacteria bacterium RIFOXYD12_FULL_49_13 TaxID=1817890 RepID=A0A1F7FDH4_UNCRA|nr:MAG: hypothetical protein A2268_04940 [Candidatus Raymondbacteria bacterium RifOxyA12_full_50_37]OGJ94090.1 MAG: hypothetical protein A2248_12145 [Candidatus Raymondbacteria bacterium RIFOXYA2_FULL_49_16]OGJ96915.1 MAG: hypothetical protein A2453_04745 [Candidatus Raymondbacteria bacterium RIFOXYC2_FULL_50_21]OGK03017.1 MAG: hypothetical protein A2350_03610 [Candidatus Raymondbacteria bacterium RifOxyB12_full_50_8]OGK04641.1 MAG: hypothetical protein A2519_20910 [Candidatus Raymondbacteria b
MGPGFFMEYARLAYLFAVLPVLKVLVVFFPFFLCGLVIRFLKERIDTVLINEYGRIPYFIFAALGTPVHELSHIIASLLFGHKVKRFSLFFPRRDGQLGYVEHAYNPDSLYQRVGCFFIGMAPVVMGCAFFFLLTRLFFPGFRFADEIYVSFKGVASLKSISALSSFFSGLAVFFKSFIMEFIGRIAAGDWKPVFYLLLTTGIGSHMFPSRADFSGTVPGIIVLYTVIVVSNFVLFLLSVHFDRVVAMGIAWTALWVNIMLLIILVLAFAGVALYAPVLIKRALSS